MESNAILRFERREQKYLVSSDAMRRLEEAAAAHVAPDPFPPSCVMNLYYDTWDCAVTRLSCEKPAFKEKLRLRSYNTPGPDGTVFVELKKKCKGVVYKRRCAMTPQEAMDYLAGRVPAPEPGIVADEVSEFLARWAVAPRAFIGYDRHAWVGTGDAGLRITFDQRLRWRGDRLDLRLGDEGELLLPPNQVIMEIKAPQAIPLWLCRGLEDVGAYPRSFSKVGWCYQQRLAQQVARAWEPATDTPRFWPGAHFDTKALPLAG